MQGMFEGMRDLSDEERQARFDEIRARLEEINKDAEAQMQNVLLPHQFERLKQIDLQSRMQRGGAAALTEGELADTLGLTESQREQIREKPEEVQKDLEEKISQLRIDARNQVLEVLTTEQRAKLEGDDGHRLRAAGAAIRPAGRPGRARLWRGRSRRPRRSRRTRRQGGELAEMAATAESAQSGADWSCNAYSSENARQLAADLSDVPAATHNGSVSAASITARNEYGSRRHSGEAWAVVDPAVGSTAAGPA